jgi:hypothetical protein
MHVRRALAAGAAGALVAAGSLFVTSGVVRAAPAGTPHLPDLQTVIPTTAFSVVQTSSGKEFRYTHLVYDSGPGPLEIQPSYDEVTGGYRGVQEIFTHDASGHWSQVSQRRVPDSFVFHAEHGHFHFPLATFGLYQVAADGGLGAPVALSPKVGFCIDDSYIYDSSVEHAGVFVGTRSQCTDPTGLRGLSVGGADEYDYRDPGQAIPFDGVADGTYWFRAVTDPNNDFVEANEANNETDVKVTISGATVTAGEVRHPDSTPPAATLTAPAEGDVVKGQVTLTASTPVASPSKVELVVDGNVVGAAPLDTSPYSLSWDSTTVQDGTHWLAARVTDSQGRIGTSAVTAVTVGNVAPPPSTDPLSVAATASSDGSGPRTASLSGLKGGNLLLALVGTDGPQGPGHTASVSGGGLTWTFVRRANASSGSAEVWKAVLPTSSTSVSATATPGGTLDASLTLIAFNGSAGLGASEVASAASGAAGATVTTTQDQSWVFGVGNDWDGATARTLASGQTMRHQFVDTAVGNTFWSQSTSAATATAGTAVTLGTTAPTNHQWNFVAVEVLAASTEPPPPDTTAPTVSITDPEAGSTVSGTTVLGATAADSVGVTSVTFTVDGTAVGDPDTEPPFMVSWDTTTASAGTHTIGAQARDAAGNVGTADTVSVTVDNTTAAPHLVTLDGKATTRATGTLTATGLTTQHAGDTLIAFVALDGPPGAAKQSARVTGAGLTWTLVKRGNTQSGDAEIWSAQSPDSLSGASVSARPAVAGYTGSLTVLAFDGAHGTGVAGATGATSGGPSIYLPGVARGSWVFAVGNDWDRAVARTPATGQVVQQQYLVTSSGSTFWVQSTAKPASGVSLVTISDSAPTDDQWNYVAVEVRPATSIRPGNHHPPRYRLRGRWVTRPIR